MQNNKDEMDELFGLFDRISQFLEEKRLEWEEKQFKSEMVEWIEGFFKEMGLEPSARQGVGVFFFKEPVEEQKAMIVFMVTGDGCSFCGYNENPKVLRFCSVIPGNWRRKFANELSSQTIRLCPTCCTEFYLQMRQELGAKVTAKELLSFLCWYSYKKTSKP